jgi:hypothetical protein
LARERLSRTRGREGKTDWGKNETGWVRERLAGAKERLAVTVSEDSVVLPIQLSQNSGVSILNASEDPYIFALKE